MAETTKKAETKIEVIDPMKTKVKVKLPRITKDDPPVYVSVNEYSCMIKRGIEVEVPLAVYEVLRNQEDMQMEAFDFDESVRS